VVSGGGFDDLRFVLAPLNTDGGLGGTELEGVFFVTSVGAEICGFCEIPLTWGNWEEEGCVEEAGGCVEEGEGWVEGVVVYGKGDLPRWTVWGRWVASCWS
jgi:hypothetical protein